jgi:hypothetical protein
MRLFVSRHRNSNRVFQQMSGKIFPGLALILIILAYTSEGIVMPSYAGSLSKDVESTKNTPIGCWEEISREKERRTPTSAPRDLCFFKSGRGVVRYLELSGEGGEEIFTWKVSVKFVFITETGKCKVWLPKSQGFITLGECDLAADWKQVCSVVAEDQGGCKSH